MVVLSAAEYSRLLDAARKDHGSFADHLMAFPGEDIPRAGKPLVKSKIEAASPKRTGFLKDQVDCPDDFITMGEDEIIALLRDGEGGGS